MTNKYSTLLLIFISLLSTSFIFAQTCDSNLLNSLTNSGPFVVNTLTEKDGIRNGSGYRGATIYYPTNGTPPFASIAIVPGFLSGPSSVEKWGPFYASHGIVTIIIGTNSTLDNPESRAKGLLDALETIKDENSRASSPLKGALNLDKMAVSGWSMGGGGAQRAAVLDNTIAAVVALCPWLPSPKLDHETPTLIFSGENDTTARPSSHADIHYDATSNTTDKLLFEIENGSHSVANSPNGARGMVGKIALSWLKLQLEDNDCYCPLLTDELLVNQNVASKVEQSFQCNLLGVNKEKFAIGFYPNPTKDIVNFKIRKDVSYQLFSPLGQRLLQGTLTVENNQINLSQFPESMYYLHIEGDIVKLMKSN